MQLVDKTEKELIEQDEQIEGKTYRPLYPALTATSVLAWKRGQPFSPAATKFIEYTKCFLGMDKA